MLALPPIYTHNSLPLYNRCDLEWADGRGRKRERERNGRCPLLLLKAGAEILDIYASPKRNPFFSFENGPLDFSIAWVSLTGLALLL